MRGLVVALGAMALAGCLAPHSQQCSDHDTGESWVCPADLACALPPVYCGTPQEVGACDGRNERDPCSSELVPDGLCIGGSCQACSNDIQDCRYIGWNPMTSPSGADLGAVWFVGPGDAYAGTTDGRLFHYQVLAWTADTTFPTLPAGATITQLWGSDKDHLFAVANGKVFFHDATGWVEHSPASPTTKAIWGPSANDLFAVGAGGSIYRWTGMMWTAQTSNTAASLAAVWGASATDVYAVGTGGTIVHWNGSTWVPSGTPTTANLRGVWGSGADSVFAVGDNTILRSTDLGVSFAPSMAPTTAMNGVWGTSRSDAFAVGDSGTVWHWDDVSWTRMLTPVSPNLRAIHGSAADEVFAVGTGGTVLRYTGASWSELDPAGTTVRLADLWAATANDVVVVGAGGTALRVQGKTVAALNAMTTMDLNGVWGRTADDVFAVGDSVTTHDASGVWTAMPNAFGILTDVDGTATTAYAAGERFAETTTTTWSSVAVSPVPRALWVAPTGVVFLAGTKIMTYDGSNTSELLATTDLQAIWGDAEDDVFAVGPQGTILHYDGTTWSPMASKTTVTLRKVWGRSGDDVFAAGDGATLLHYHAGLWKPIALPASVVQDLASVGGSGSSIYVCGDAGALQRLIETAP